MLLCTYNFAASILIDLAAFYTRKVKYTAETFTVIDPDLIRTMFRLLLHRTYTAGQQLTHTSGAALGYY